MIFGSGQIRTDKKLVIASERSERGNLAGDCFVDSTPRNDKDLLF